MRPRALNVHLGLSGDSRALSPFQECEAVVLVLNDELTESLHVNTLHPIFTNVERLLLLGILQEIIDLLVVDLDEGAENRNAYVILPDLVKQVSDAAGNDTALLG